MQNGSHAPVNTSQPFQPTLFLQPDVNKPSSRPGSTGPPSILNSRSSSGASSPAMPVQPVRPLFQGPPGFDRNAYTPPNLPSSFKPTSSLPTSLNTSPNRTPRGSSGSINNLPSSFGPPNGMPPQMTGPPSFNGPPRPPTSFPGPPTAQRPPGPPPNFPRPAFTPSPQPPAFGPPPTSQPFPPTSQPFGPPSNQPSPPTQPLGPTPTSQPLGPPSNQPSPPTQPLGPPPTSQPLGPPNQPSPPNQPFPPTSQPFPPTSQPFPPTSQPFPPTSQPFPPTSQPFPPTSQPLPPTSQPFPPTSQPFRQPPPHNSQPSIFPPSSQPFAPPPTSQPFAPPPTSQPFPPTSQPFPPTSQPFGPPSNQPFPPTSQPPTFPPTSQPFAPPPFGPPSQPFAPPTGQPGMPLPSRPPFAPPGPPSFAPGYQPTFPGGAPPPLPDVAPPPPTDTDSAPSRLGASGLRAKRPVPRYDRPVDASGAPPPGYPPGGPAPPGAAPGVPSPTPPPGYPGSAPYSAAPPGSTPMADPAADRMRSMSLSDMSFINLMEHRSVFPKEEQLTCLPPVPPEILTKNKHPEHFCSTLNAIPASSGLLSRLKVPFGLVIQPFKDLEEEMPIVHPPIPRCKVCRTYVNPYVQLNDGARRWKCNICARLNDMPADYFYGEDGRRVPFEVDKRPELSSSVVEYIAPTEYCTRPPQAAMYLYLIDVSFGAVQSGMLRTACKVLGEELDNVSGDGRKSIGILALNSKLHYFNLHKKSGQPQMLVVPDLEEPFIPTIDELMVNVGENKEKLKELLDMLPSVFEESTDADCAAGPALRAAKELMFRSGGRVTLMLSRTPSIGVGKLSKRTDNTKAEGLTLNPSDDFYKTFALECMQKQVAVDLFLFPNDTVDLPTLSTISQFSSGSVYFYPNYHAEKNPVMGEKFLREFRHYITRPVGFEAVLRIRCTSGLSIHSFIGNCFVRAPDLIALANVSPDVSFGVQINIEDSLHENKLAIFQSALLYTSMHGDRRIRVHTLALPITSDPQTVLNNLNITASVALLSKLAVVKSNSASLGDAREALQYSVIDPLSKFRSEYHPGSKGSGQLLVPKTQRLLPLFVSSLLKSPAFRLQNVSIDDRYSAMLAFKTLPVEDVMLMVYPRLFSLHNLAETWTDKNAIPPRLPLTAEKLTRQGAFLLQTHEYFIIWLGRHVSDIFVNSVYNTASVSELPEISNGLEPFDNSISTMVHDLISLCAKVRDVPYTLISVREDSRFGTLFLQHLVEDRSDGQISYYEFLQKVQQQVG